MTLAVILGVAATVTAVAVPVPAARGVTSPSGELVIIDSVSVGQNLVQDACGGSGLTLPVTVVATFIPPPDGEPVGPYATSSWSGGFGSSDDHFGTSQAHALTQAFHILMRASGSAVYGEYTGSVIVQDVGLAGGFATRDAIPINITSPPAFAAPSSVKCPLFHKTDPNDMLKSLAKQFALFGLKTWVCPACGTALKYYKIFKGALGYGDMLWDKANGIVPKDPPDPAYQLIASPTPPPVLPPPDGLTAAERAKVTALYTALATSVGDLNALSVSIDRAWGAGNAGSTYWYDQQLLAQAKYAARASADLRKLPAAYAAVQALFKGQALPALPVTAANVAGLMATLGAGGLPADATAVLTQLHVSAADQRQMAQDLLAGAGTTELTAANAAATVLAPPEDYPGIASVLDGLSAWDAGSVATRRPAVSGLSVTSGPAAGGDLIEVDGAGLGSVSGISFGPSSPDAGLAPWFSCEPQRCEAIVPPGTGTVNVIADGPGGPSAATATARYTYQPPSSATPVVTRIFPATGPVIGATSVAIFGSGLAGGRVYFGPTLADKWTCTNTLCTAVTFESASADTVDVTVANATHTSARVAADRFTFTSGSTKPPAPTVTGVSPASGNSLGGDTVTITGTGFTGATSVSVGGNSAPSFTVTDDTHLTATTPFGTAGVADVTVFGPGGASAVTSADHYTFVKAVPVITGISPKSGPTTGGTTVTVTGHNLNTGDVEVSGGGFPSNQSCTATKCTITTAAGAAGTFNVQVITGNGTSAVTSADRFTFVKAPAPVITGIAPAVGSTAGGDSVVIYGTNLGGGQVSIGGQGAAQNNGTGCALTSCVVTTSPETAGAKAVVVTRLDGAKSKAGSFTYVKPGPPVITAVTPTSGFLHGVPTIEVIGRNLTGGDVFVGATEALDVACSDSACSGVAYGPKAGTLDVTVKTPVGTSAKTAADKFTLFSPSVTKVSPSSGWTMGGLPVTITGTHLADGTVLFGNTIASKITCTDTTCTGTTPAVSSAGTVNVTVDADQGSDPTPTTAADHFTYSVLPAPTVTGVSPASGTDSGGDQVTITGTHLDGGTVRIGGKTATGTCMDTKCVVITPFNTTDGPADVTVTTSTATSPVTASSKFTYHPPGVPTVTSVSPVSGSASGGTVVAITGTNLTNGTVKFGTVSATGVTCTATTCGAISPPGAVGTVHVTVVTLPGGTSATSSADQFSYTTPPAPAITGISPATGPSSGGVPVTITGANLINGSVKFGGTAATSVSCADATCTATAPALAAGIVDVTVTTGGGTSAATAADRFTADSIAVSVSAIPGVGINTQPGGGQVYAAADGSTWFAMPNLNEIGKIAAGGTITTVATLDTGGPSGAKPDGITQTPDGTTWYTEDQLSKIVSIDSGGTQHGYQIPGDFHDSRDLTTGPDGRLWFTMAASGAIGAMTTGGAISLYPLPDPSVFPNDIRPGPDGRLWFTETLGDAIGAITTSGKVTEYPIPPGPVGGGMAPFGITAGPDGRMWFADGEARALGAITTSGVVTSYPLPSTIGQPHSLAAGPDGRIWFTESGFDEVFALSPATGAVADYPLPPGSATGTVPDNLAMAKDGSLWVDEGAKGGVIHVTAITTGVTPAVTFITPNAGPVGGGTAVTITGTNLAGATAVTFGSAPATGVTVLDAAHVRATAPARSAGPVDIKVTTPSGTTAAVAADRYYYGTPPAPIPNVSVVTPATGSTAGGARVTIKGTSLAGGTVAFGSTAATGVSCSATSCTATAPKHAAGTVDVRVHTASGTSPVAAGDTFTYQAPPPPRPVVKSVSPASGPPGGGNAVTIKGTSLAGGIVSIGLTVVPATCTATACVVTMPPGAPGTTSDVHVTTAGGTSATSSADHYTYRPTRSISATLSPSSVKKGASATLSGTVSPKAAGLTVILQRQSGTTWVAVAAVKLDAKSAYKFTIKGTSTGTFHYRVTMSASSSFAASASPVRALKVT